MVVTQLEADFITINMQKIFVIAALAVLALATIVAANDGGDISEPYDVSTFECCKRNGWSFMSVRSYHSYGAPDTNAPRSLAAAKAAGIEYRDVYHFPCRGKDAAQQVADDINAVGADNFGMIWFDIETTTSPGCEWSSYDQNSNCQFLGQMIAKATAMGKKPGVYSSVYEWGQTVGEGCSVGADNGAPLWYAHYDGTRSFDDFTSFGGWTKPNIKQYADHVGICGINADADWYPA